jgi:2-keto-4-pentenoate hydratase
MMQTQVDSAAAILWKNWQQRTRIDELPATCRPTGRGDAYAAQRELVRLSGQRVVGWKIAATSTAGQKHIGVDGPLAGPLLADRVLGSGATLPMDENIMRVAEAEFAFTFSRDLPRRSEPYTQQEVLAAVKSLHPAIELPDSRYNDYAKVGAPQLIADTACACWFAIGAPADAEWRERNLAAHGVTVYRNGERAAVGSGGNVLGDPAIALLWLVNELRTFGEGIHAGQFVTTGTCVIPVPVSPGDIFRADFGDLGSIHVTLS